MKEEAKISLSRNAVIIFLAIVIITVILIEDIAKTSLSKLYIMLPALFILGECIKAGDTKKIVPTTINA